MEFNQTCIEVLHKPSIEDLRVTLRVIHSALKDMGCEAVEGASWIIALCSHGLLVESSVSRPREVLEAPPRLSVTVRFSGRNEDIFYAARRILSGLRDLGIPAELLPGCQRLP